jgi:hypothetical protein
VVNAGNTAEFIASDTLQKQIPEAFVLQPEAKSFLINSYAETLSTGDKLVELIRAEKDIVNAIKQWETLSFAEQTPILRRIFSIEVSVFGTRAPTLLIDNHSYPNRLVNFDFDLAEPAKRIVYLNPDKFADEKKYASLAFLLHETRHSFQYQRAFEQNKPFQQAYLAAFTAQKQLKGFGFSNFLTLNNEYEAFLFGNYVLGKLTNWQVDMPSMGTFASQFNEHGVLKMDLRKLQQKLGSETLLQRYNERALTQKALLNR